MKYLGPVKGRQLGKNEDNHALLLITGANLGQLAMHVKHNPHK